MLTLIALLFAAISLAHGYRKQAEDPFAFLSTDDAMRMVQVLDLRDGAGWYDLTQRRLAPPDGVVMHWSRLPDLPLLAVLVVAEPLVGREEAVRLATLVVPPVLGLLFFAAFVWAAAPLIERRRLPVAGLVCITLFLPQLSFQPGAVDHHGWHLIFAMIGAGAVLRAANGRIADRVLAAAGAAGAMGLWVGTEAVPIVFFVSAALSLHWLVGHQKAARNLLIYAGAVTLTSFLLYPLAIPPSNWASRDCDTFSLVSLGLALALLIFSVSLATLDRRLAFHGILPRLSCAGLIGAALVALLLTVYPNCLAGPYGPLSPETVRLVSLISESRPLAWVISNAPARAAFVSALPVIALGIALSRISRGDPDKHLLWLSLLTLILGSSAMLFWQIRMGSLANAYSGIAVCWWLAQVWKRAQSIRYLVDRFFLRLAALLAVPALPFVSFLAVAAMTDQTADEGPHRCDLASAVQLLNSPPFSESTPLLIASHVNIGPALLLFTPHQVIAAPYHRNSVGLKAIREIFSGDEAQARRTAASLGVDLVYICGGKSRFETAGADSSLPTFYDRLESGDVAPWLTEIRLPNAEDRTRFYRINIARLQHSQGR
ncbi:hypothetical protein [Thiorhodococcus minor]|nr:hypothetical protein [Thiorhodococcus minor]